MLSRALRHAPMWMAKRIVRKIKLNGGENSVVDTSKVRIHIILAHEPAMALVERGQLGC